MLRIPKHGIAAMDFRHFFDGGSSAGTDDPAGDMPSFRDAVMRGIMSAAVILVLVILFLL